MTKQVKATKPSEPAVEVKETKKVDPIEAAVQEVKKSVAKASKKKEAAPVAEPVEEDKEDEKEVRKRSQATREDLEASFDALLLLLTEEVDGLRKNDDKSKSKGVRFLRTVTKTVRNLRTVALRLANKKNRRAATTTGSSGNSGFMKPVNISTDMQTFTGIKKGELVSRVDVTKAICNYVKEKNLQIQTDRRQFTPDEKLAKLLGTNKPVTYYDLQRHIQPHFIKDVAK